MRYIYIETFVRNYDVNIFDTWAFGNDVNSTSLVNNTSTNWKEYSENELSYSFGSWDWAWTCKLTLTLITLSIEDAPINDKRVVSQIWYEEVQTWATQATLSLPYKFTTNRAKCRLPEIGGHELVAVDLVNFSSQGYATSVECLSILLEHFLIGIDELRGICRWSSWRTQLSWQIWIRRQTACRIWNLLNYDSKTQSKHVKSIESFDDDLAPVRPSARPIAHTHMWQAESSTWWWWRLAIADWSGVVVKV